MEFPDEAVKVPEAIDGEPPNSDVQRHVVQHVQRRRNRETVTCTECKRRKIRCSRDIPCYSCSARGAPESCRLPPRPQPHDKYVTRREFNDLVQRVDRIMNKLEAVSPASHVYDDPLHITPHPVHVPIFAADEPVPSSSVHQQNTPPVPPAPTHYALSAQALYDKPSPPVPSCTATTLPWILDPPLPTHEMPTSGGAMQLPPIANHGPPCSPQASSSFRAVLADLHVHPSGRRAILPLAAPTSPQA
ncbi:hypothetical protein PHLGIDRAFT_37254 [Phlebiopsis gigantea 11061_1 CR5-6]|uniref:Zn(2)-C6 fungal-type domain-containing protein n=1 Tax=Phlebiopsis gigantea (strain 11061_1 CR5-6) TaxID=745531 RepID=A0A0C3PEG1_PHLG1|nr:hypothetical protein PHLGIDRAFT_37254 [Phlebiopsis gigantea 11061_1 CR5-6]